MSRYPIVKLPLKLVHTYLVCTFVLGKDRGSKVRYLNGRQGSWSQQ